ncbi:MAG: hypothetical protein GEU78_00675 [Actinobacteria bacterium]|nr:hypothetical protein [Actinomycetota bacterium]
MEQAAWTAIGLLAASVFGSIFYLGARIDALGARLHGRIDALTGRIDALSGRIDSLGSRLDAHLERHPS